MSTKAIREALRYLDTLMEEPPQGASPQEKEIHAAALAEVEAIERAAKALSDEAKGAWPRNSAALNERDRAHRLMWLIAKQEP